MGRDPDHQSLFPNFFGGDPADIFSIAIVRCQLMKRLSDNYPTKLFIYRREAV